MELKEQILQALGLSSEEEVKFEAQAKLIDGTIIVSTADELVEGVDISVLAEDGTTMLLPVGEYETEEGLTFVVEEEGVIASIGEAEPEEEETEEAPEEEEMQKEDFDKVAFIDEVKSVVEDLVAEATKDIDELKSEIAQLKEDKTNLETEKAELETKLSKQPAGQPVDTKKFTKTETKTELSSVEVKRMSAQERFLYNLNN